MASSSCPDRQVEGITEANPTSSSSSRSGHPRRSQPQTAEETAPEIEASPCHKEHAVSLQESSAQDASEKGGCSSGEASSDPCDHCAACSSKLRQLEQEKANLQERLEFVEELLGPTEAQRKLLQDQVIAARTAALKARMRGASLPTKVTGRLDEMLLWSRGLSERDAGLLQGGCLPDADGVLQDVSMLGDPNFHPYNPRNNDLKWQARGGVLQLSLGEVCDRFGEDVALDVVRCAKELDEYDASRRVGIELPWHPLEERELEPAEVINLMDRELTLAANLSYVYHDDPIDVSCATGFPVDIPETDSSPYAVANSPPPERRSAAGGPRRKKHSRGSARQPQSRNASRVGGRLPSLAQPLLGARAAPQAAAVRRIYGAASGGAVAPLPRVHSQSPSRAPSRRRGDGAASGSSVAACALPGLVPRPRMQEPLSHPLLGPLCC